jgi:polar amino acid transport system substrate-binding protein
MKKVPVIFMLLWILFSTAAATAQTITLAYVDFPPFEFQKADEPQGILVQIVQTVFQRAGISLELTFLPFNRAFDNTKRGTIDGLFNFYKIKERLQFFDYSEPLIDNPLVFFVRKDSTIQFHNMESLAGLSVGIIPAYTYGSDFDNNTGFIKERTNTHLSNLRKLLYGRIDIYPCDKLVGIHVARQNAFMEQLKILPTPIAIMKGHIGFTKGKHKEIIGRINPIIEQMRNNEEISRIVEEYMAVHE